MHKAGRVKQNERGFWLQECFYMRLLLLQDALVKVGHLIKEIRS